MEAPNWFPAADPLLWLLGAWLVLVLAYGLWRAVAKPDPDTIRPSGPIA